MKHSKKMIMVPEAEWLTMLNMIKGSEPLAREKVGTEMKMAKVLRDPKLSEDVKAKKYSWLFKQRRQLKKEISEDASKPQKIVIDPEQLDAIKSDLSKYLGVAPTKPATPAPAKAVSKGLLMKRRVARKRNKPNQVEVESDEYLDASDDQVEREPQQPSTSANYTIHPNYRDNFIKIIKGYPVKLNINLKTREVGNIKGSNYEDIVDYLTNKNLPKPLGTDFLLAKMKDEPFYKKALDWADQHRQKGDGKGKRTKKAYKQTTFTPVIWEKII